MAMADSRPAAVAGAAQTVYVDRFCDGIIGRSAEVLGTLRDGGTIVASTAPGCWGPMIAPAIKGGREVTLPVNVDGAEVGDAIALRIRSIDVTSLATSSGNDRMIDGRFNGDPYCAKVCANSTGWACATLVHNRAGVWLYQAKAHAAGTGRPAAAKRPRATRNAAGNGDQFNFASQSGKAAINASGAFSATLGGGAASIYGNGGATVTFGSGGQYFSDNTGGATLTLGAGGADTIFGGAKGDSVTAAPGSAANLLYYTGTGGGDTINLAKSSGANTLELFNSSGGNFASKDTVFAGTGSDVVMAGGGDRIGVGDGTSTVVGGTHTWTHSDTTPGSSVAKTTGRLRCLASHR